MDRVKCETPNASNITCGTHSEAVRCASDTTLETEGADYPPTIKEGVQSCPGSDIAMLTIFPFRRLLIGCALLLLPCAMAYPCAAQPQRSLCNKGNNEFQAIFRTGVGVTVESAKSEGLSVRQCQASLQWKTENIVVAENAAQIDLDLFGVDLVKNGPVAAFQIKKSAAECCASYQIYSLEKPPRLLRTITGGSIYTASDRDLDGRVEIWTDDSAAMNGLDGIQLAYMEYPPACVLRFENGKLLDASGEFQDYFDGIAGRIREAMNPDALQEFKRSDGRLQADISSDFDRIVRMRRVKIQILEIVLAYLYSGREQEAWRGLSEMWPAGDVERIRREIVNARSKGILSQVDGVSEMNPRARQLAGAIYKQTEVTPARAIYLWRPEPSNSVDYTALETEVVLDLVIDSAGKVSSAAPWGKEGTADDGLLSAAREWKFIPGLKNGHSVASQLRIYTSLRR